MGAITKTYIINICQFEDEAVFNNALEVISPYRRQKIALLKSADDKKRSLAAAIALNAALQVHGLEERMMEYDLGFKGKPYFRYNPEHHFSLSHSGNYAICSMGGCEVGNDIEKIRAGRERVAERFFTKEELDWIHEAEQPEEKEERIFRIWTMKESFLKVTGWGMSLPLKDFTVMVKENGNTHIHHKTNDKTYYIKEYDIPEAMEDAESYRIAVCSEGMDFAQELEIL